MTSEPLVSIIIPTFNRAGTIRRAIDSALAQDWPGIEVLVIDDCSSDETPAIVRDYADRHVRLIERPENGGAAAARNTGIAAARGDYIAFLDSDDQFLADKVRMQVEALRAAGEDWQVSCTSHYLHMLDAGTVVEQRLAPARDDFLRMYLGCELSPGATLMARRDVFERVGPLDESLKRFEDWDWLLRYTAAGGRILIVQDLLARIYNRKNRLSGDVRDSVGRFVEILKDRYPDMDRRLRSRTIAGMWMQLYTTALGEGRLLIATNAVLHGLGAAPLTFGLGMMRQLNASRVGRDRGESSSSAQQRPSIALVARDLATGIAENLVSRLANALAARGWAVSLLVYCNADAAPASLSSGVDYIPLGSNHHPTNWLGQIRSIRRAIKQQGSCLVLSFADGLNVQCLLAMIAAGTPVVVCEPDDPAMRSGGYVVEFLRRRLYPRAVSIVVPTEHAAKRFPRYMQPEIAVLPIPVSTTMCDVEVTSADCFDTNAGLDAWESTLRRAGDF